MLDLQHLTVKEVGEVFGTDHRFKVWLDATKTIVEIEKQNVLLGQRRGSLVSRDLMRHTIFSALEEYHRRMLTDMPRTIAARVYAAARSDVLQAESEGVIQELMSSALRNVKETVVRLLGAEDDG